MTAHKILVATDFSTHSDKAFSEALDLSEREKGQVYLLHVVPDDIIQCVEMYCLEEEQLRDLAAQSMQSARAQLVEQLKRHPRAMSLQVEPIVETGKVYEKILEFERSRGIDLVVLGAYGGKGMSRFLAGSTARNVIKGATSSVLVVR